VALERVAASGHTLALQPTPAASARSRPGCRWGFIARLAKSGSWRRAPHPAAARGRGARSSQAAPPAFAPLPRPPATARPLVCKSSAPRLRHRVRAFDSLPPLGQLILRATAAPPSKTPPSLGVFPRACGPRAAAAPAPLRLSPSLPLLQSPAPSSRSHRVRARQGILPVKNFGRWNSASQQSPLRPNF